MKDKNKLKNTIQASIIIPSFNRQGLVLKVLNAFSKQTVPCDSFEILVIDDASAPPLSENLITENFPFKLKIIRHSRNRGQGAARNSGIKEAKGNILIFVDDDIIPDKTFIQEHLNSHATYSSSSMAVVGMVSWAKEIPITPVMYYLDNGGPFLCLKKFDDKSRLPILISGNTSINKNFLMKNGLFDETFNEYGWEDIDLGYRLMGKGLKVILNKKAEGYHYKHMDLDSVILRQYQCGRSAYRLYTKYPDIFPGITNLHPLFKSADSNKIIETIKEFEKNLNKKFTLKPGIIPPLWKEYDKLCDLHFFKGLKSRLIEEFNNTDEVLECCEKGVSAYIQENWRLSVDYFSVVKKKCYDFFPIRWYLILSLFKNKEYDWCEAELHELLSIFPESIWGYYTLGALQEKRDRPQEAIETFIKTAHIVGERVELKNYKGGSYFHTGVILLKLNRKKEAMKYFKYCLDLQPDHRSARQYLTQGSG